MNEIFDFKRFGAFAARSWSLYTIRYLSHLSAFAGVIFLLTILVCALSGGGLGAGDLQELTPWLLVLSVAFFATFPVTVMKPFKSRDTLVMENTLPASTTEKWLFVFLNTTVVAFVLYFAAFAVTVLTGMAISGADPFAEYVRDFRTWGDNMEIMVPFTILFQAVVMYAGTMERRNHILSAILVAASLFGVFFMLWLFPMWLSDRLGTWTIDATRSFMSRPPEWGPMFTFGTGWANAPGAEIRYENIPYFDYQLTYYLCAATTLLLWVASWFNFRQRSIK